VLERGALVASGPAVSLARSSIVREAYLGAPAAAAARPIPA
jgi:ABC-type branched-subunit amino acid transport system ATPase component